MNSKYGNKKERGREIFRGENVALEFYFFLYFGGYLLIGSFNEKQQSIIVVFPDNERNIAVSIN